MAKSSYDILIARLDEFIRKYYLNQLIRGILLFAAITGAYFLLASVSEYRMYFSGGVRKVFLTGFLVLSLATLAIFIAKPLLGFWRLGKTISHEEAARVVGNHFSDIQDKLLNILQLRTSPQQGRASSCWRPVSVRRSRTYDWYLSRRPSTWGKTANTCAIPCRRC